jgi:hypothetical protein
LKRPGSQRAADLSLQDAEEEVVITRDSKSKPQDLNHTVVEK